jgi:D-alanyl-D-alanine carboxypeptidase
MKRFPGIFSITVIIFSILLLSSCSDTVVTPQNNENNEKIKRALDSIRLDLELQIGRTVPSLNILINTPNHYIFASSSAQGVAPVTAETYFRFASNTKNFTSTAILKMYQAGWLDLYAGIVDLIPGGSIQYVPTTPEWNIPFKDDVTIEQLLQHSAGIYDVDNDPVPGFGGMSYVDYMKSIDPDFQFTSTGLVEQVTKNNLFYFLPGTGYHYSNTGYTILSEIIARVYSFRSGSQKKYSDYLYDHITGSSAPVPLNVAFPDLASQQQLPSPYVSGTQVENSGNVTVYADANMSAHVAEGNGYGTFVELNKYIRSLMKGTNVLTQQYIELMKHDVSTANPNYALGCFHVPNLGYGHNGAINGNLSFMLYDPDVDVSVIILMPLIDYQNLGLCSSALVSAGYESRTALGFPGRP